MIRVVLVDRAETIRYSLKFALEIYDEFVVSGEGKHIGEVQQVYPSAHPDIVIVSSFETGLEDLNLVYQVRQTYPNCKIILLGLTSFFSEEMLRNAGVNIFLPKTLELEQLVRVLRET